MFQNEAGNGVVQNVLHTIFHVQPSVQESGRKGIAATDTLLYGKRFLVGCYTGLRFSDVVSLRQENIADGWLVKSMLKTKFTVEIPVRDLFGGKMMALIAKYGGDIGKLTKRLGCNSAVNRTLRGLLNAIGADAKITFHSSRHTFATLLGQQGVDLPVVSKLLGHRKIQTTEIYREVDRRSIEIEVQRVKA